MVRRSVPASNKCVAQSATQSVWGDAFADASLARGLATGDPDGFVRDGVVRIRAEDRGWETSRAWACASASTRAGPQQGWTERQIAIFAALAGHHAEDHPLAIDIADLQTREFGAAHAGAVEGHQQRASKQCPCRIDQTRDFLPTQHRRQPAPVLGIGQEIAELVALQSLHKKNRRAATWLTTVPGVSLRSCNR